jgi:hypothetical protein
VKGPIRPRGKRTLFASIDAKEENLRQKSWNFFFFFFFSKQIRKGLQGGIFPTSDPEGRENGRSCGNASKNMMGSGPFS